MLSIKDLHVEVGGKAILNGLTLEVAAGEVHAIMGPNGSGKSTLAHALMGREGYAPSKGSITFKGKDLTALEADARAGEGLFLGFQYPVEIPGVSTMNFLRTAMNAIHKYRNEDEISAGDFLRELRAKAKTLNLSDEMLKRFVNTGFSGGEKKRNEMLQMAMLDPDFAVLDETDSGLDIDALKVVADAINALRAPHKAILLITHYQRLLDYVKPDYVHVLSAGRIVKSGGPELAHELEREGYAGIAA